MLGNCNQSLLRRTAFATSSSTPAIASRCSTACRQPLGRALGSRRKQLCQATSRRESQEQAGKPEGRQEEVQQEIQCTLSGMDSVECEYVDSEARGPQGSQQASLESAPDLVQVAGPFGLLILVSPFMFWVSI